MPIRHATKPASDYAFELKAWLACQSPYKINFPRKNRKRGMLLGLLRYKSK